MVLVQSGALTQSVKSIVEEKPMIVNKHKIGIMH